MFELHNRYTLAMPKGTISETGITLIQGFISSQNLQSDDWKAKNPNTILSDLPPLPNDWQWQWLVTGRGEYVGTFPKRVSKYYFQTYSIKSPNSLLQMLGNLARQHSNEQTEYTFDFTDKFDWQAGDFGDSGSCFWGSNSNALIMLDDNDCLAIRFYKDDKSYGRAWLSPLEENLYMVFNGYGFSSLTIARIFSTYIGLSYKKIRLTNRDSNDGTLWINNGNGYIVGSAEFITTIEHYDFNWKTPLTCHSCHDEINEDDYYRGPNDNQYCQDCFYEYYDYCYGCDEAYDRDSMYFIDELGREMCETCYNRNEYVSCHDCGETRSHENLTKINDDYHCDSCRDREFIECRKCGTWLSRLNLDTNLCKNHR